MKKELSNYQILQIYDNLSDAFIGENAKNIYLPIKISFAIMKNISILKNLSSEIEEARINICKHYGELSEDGSKFTFRKEDKEKVNEEFADLLNMTQEVDFRVIKLKDIEKIELKMSQMQALMLIIDEEAE